MSESTFIELLDLYVDAIVENLRETDYRVKYALPQTKESRRRDAHELDTRDAVLKKVAELSAERDELSTACHDLIIAIQEGDSEPVSEIVRAWSAVSAVEARRNK